MKSIVDLPRFEERSIPAIGYNCMRKVWDEPKLVSMYRGGRHTGQWQTYTMREQGEEQQRLATAWRMLGLRSQDRVAIMSPNRPRWIFTIYSLMIADLVAVPVYATLTADEAAFILRDAGARAIVVDSLEQAAKIASVKAGLPDLEQIIVMDALDAEPPAPARSYDSVLAMTEGHEDIEALAEIIRAITPDHLAAIIYTSGTTGEPKGVMLTHGNFMSQRPVLDLFNLGPDDVFLNHLPFSHSFGLTTDLFGSVATGATLVISDGFAPEKIRHALTTIRPTVLMSVPRLYEKVYMQVRQVVDSRPPFVQRLFEGALATGKAVFDLEAEGRPVPMGLALKHRFARRIACKVLQRAGLERLRLAYAGGAPTSRELCHFFQGLGINVYQGYGLTETSPIATVNRPGHNRLGTVGQPAPDTEIRIADDGEVLIRGPLVMRGYFNNPAATAEAIDPEGWFHSGDIGELDQDGFLRIVDRKKELIVTSGGKNIAPLGIECRFNTDPCIERVVVIGDRRHYLTALVCPEFHALERWAETQGLGPMSHKELAAHPAVYALFEASIAAVNAQLARFEQIKKFTILDTPFSVDTGEITPTEKVKRRVVEDRYAALIEAMYAGG